MKATGMVRKLDNLGRIVIPKEIRNSMHIKDGENLEIYTDKDNIVLRKFSNIDNISVLADDMVSAINFIVDENVLITDLEKIISCDGYMKKELINKNLSEELYQIIKDRRSNIFNNQSISVVDEKIDCNYIITPILVNSEVIGSIMIISKDRELKKADFDILKMMSLFFTKYLEQ